MTENHSLVRIGFEDIDKGQGIVLQTLHTGQSSQDIDVRGKIKGAGLVRRRVQRPPDLSSIPFFGKRLSAKQRRYVTAIVFSLIPVVLVPLGYFSWLPTELDFRFYFFVAFFGVFTILCWSIALSTLRKRLPDKLEVFWED